jgi:hypothetical protein
VPAEPSSYWVFEPTGATRWSRPVIRCEDEHGDEFFADLVSNGTARDLADLPHGGALVSVDWTCSFDEDGTPYYWRTGHVQWEEPAWDHLPEEEEQDDDDDDD